MIIPSKMHGIKGSCLDTSSRLLEKIGSEYVDVHELYGRIRNSFNSVAEYIESLCLLALLEEVSIEDNKVRRNG